jgi:UDP-2,3-diacylglucosamine pyrophosphatase LpxH
MRRSFYWPSIHTEVLREILAISKAGTRVTFIPGNHDDDFRKLAGLRVGEIKIATHAVHVTQTGQRLLVLHGDEFDNLIKCNTFMVSVGTIAYGALLRLNRVAHWTNSLLGRPYFSLAQHVKSRVKNARHYVDRFKRACMLAAQEAGLDGVVSGHIHRADVFCRGAVMYCNSGDWVESCSAIVEDEQGQLSLINWHELCAIEAAAIRQAA